MKVHHRGTENTEKLLTVVAILLLAGCSKGEGPAPQAASTPSKGPTEVVRIAPVDQIYEAAGTVRARNVAILSARVPGSITAVRVKAGDRVSRGQVLLTLESAELDAQVSRAQAGLAVAQGGITESERDVAAAEANARLAAATYSRYRDLQAKKSISPQEFDEVEARQRTAQAQLEMSRARRQQALARLEQAQAEGRATRTVHSYASIAAPFAGVVSERKADPGTVAWPGMPLLTVEEDDQFRLEVELAESKASAVRIGDSARISLDSQAAEFVARVSEIEPASDPLSRTVLVKLALPKASGLRSGAYGRARFTLGRRDALTVPASAVERRGQLASVMVEEGGALRRRLITTGVETSGRVEVLSGLTAGEKVAVRP